jgi:hypothetical protein
LWIERRNTCRHFQSPFFRKEEERPLWSDRQNIWVIQGWRQLPVFVSLRVTRSTGKRQGVVHALQVFLPITISINKGVDNDRQQTGNKSGEQTSSFFFLTQLSVQPKRKTAATDSLFEIPGCFADVLWLKAKVNRKYLPR